MEVYTLDTQSVVEQNTYTDAKKRQHKDNEKANKRQAWSESKLGLSFTSSATNAFQGAVRAFVNQPSEQGRRMNRAAEKLRETGLEPEVIAHLFTKALYNLLPLTHRRRVKRVSMCIKAADLIHDEWRIRTFASQDNRKALLKKLFKQFDKRTYPRDWRKRTILNYFYAEQVEWSAWSTHDKLHVGYALLVLFRDHTGLINAESSSVYVDPTPVLLEAINAAIENRVLDYMVYPPMVVKPLPWTTDHLFRGGYLSTKLIRRYPLIKGSRKRDIERFNNMDWSQIIPAVNALQETPWRVNKTMLDTLEWAMFERGGGMAGLPLADAKPLPPEPYNYRTDEEVKKEHNRVCFLIHSENREIISKRLMVMFTISVARQFKNFKTMYFPHNLDSRGRAYPLPAFLNPQGPDFTKSLLEFADGKPINTEEHASWLAIAGANAFGKDKITLQERVDWVQDNDEMIFSIARDPRSDLRWTEASEPFQFLRFCLEWNSFWKHGFGYVSHMVVPVDATCSGLQHYSAMLRDEVGGRSVNLIPEIPRQDIYQDVADVVIEEMMAHGTSPDHPSSALAQGWMKFGIDRKITKRQVMVVPYAGTFSSCMEYTRSAVADKVKEGHLSPWGEADSLEWVVYLAKLIWAAIDKVVVKGKEAMRWLSKAASEYSKWSSKVSGTAHAKRMSWVTPDGFEAIHYRSEEKKKRVDTFLDGRVSLVYHESTDDLSSRDMALAVAPNFVHSYDACLLRLSVNKGVSLGLTHFGMVHDSFGVHAHDMDKFLNACIKPSFIDMYQTNALEQFRDRLPEQVKDNLEPLPIPGSLKLHGVLHNEFFFS